MDKKLPLVSVITVNYNGKRFLNDCLGSLLDLNYPKDKLEIFLVDNGSTDGSVDYVKNNFPSVKIILNSENNYTKANNMGIRQARGEYVALINNDTKVDKDWLIALITSIQKDTSIGAVGSKILFMDGSIQSVGHQEYPNYYWGDIGFCEEDKGQYNIEKEVISICGCSVLYRKKCLEDVGLLDEDFNIYMEDVDMAIRCRNKKWKLLTCPGSIIQHKYHGTIKSDDNSFYWVETNRLLLIAKHWPDKLADALSGKDYFTIRNSYTRARDISETMSKVFSKLLKEHGYETLNKLNADLFEAIRKIYNFEKNYLIQNITNEREEKNSLIIELDAFKKENQQKTQELAFKSQGLFLRDQHIASLRQDLESLKQQKESELASLKQQKEREFASLSQQKEQEKDALLLQKQQELSLLKQQKESEVAYLIQQKESELNNHKFLLAQIKKELNNIYSSTGYRYFLKPLWDFLWPIKQEFKKLKCKMKIILNNLSGLRGKKIDIIEKISRIISKMIRIYNSLPLRKKWATVYINHIKYKTIPPMPKRLTLMLNRTCNLRCKFCDVPDKNHKKTSLSKEDVFRIIDAVKKIGIREMILTGGEPFLHPDLFEIIDYANSQNIKSVITTNGLFIKQHINQIAGSHVDCISVSIDGKEATHDFIRNRQGAYKDALEAIYLLKQNGINVSVNFVVTNKNINELEDTYNLFFKLGIKVSFLPVINKPDLFPSKKEEKDVYLRFIKKLLRRNRISVYEYRYLESAIMDYFKKENVDVRCLGLSYELAIDTFGDISPCCVWENRKPQLNNLGNMLETDIQELWYSSKFHQARLSIFNEGCRGCFNPSIVDLPEMAGINFLSPAQKKENIAKPSHVHMRFTSRCNLSCRHCDIWKTGKDCNCEISVQDWKKCIDRLHMWLGSFKLDLAGGEILLYNGAIDLVRYCVSKGISVNLTTNATLIDDIMAEEIANSGLYCINLSLDGLEDIHCYTRNNPSVFFKVKQAASKLLKYRKLDIPYISLSTVITKYNLKQLPEIIKLTQEWGINNISFQALAQNFGAKYEQGWYKDNEFWPKEFKEAENAIDNLIAMKKSGVRIDNSYKQLNAFKDYYSNPVAEIKNKCNTGKKNFIINEHGDVLLCWNMMAAGNILKEDPEQIWNCKIANLRRKQIEACNRTCRILNCNYNGFSE